MIMVRNAKHEKHKDIERKECLSLVRIIINKRHNLPRARRP